MQKKKKKRFLCFITKYQTSSDKNKNAQIQKQSKDEIKTMWKSLKNQAKLYWNICKGFIPKGFPIMYHNFCHVS